MRHVVGLLAAAVITMAAVRQAGAEAGIAPPECSPEVARFAPANGAKIPINAPALVVETTANSGYPLLQNVEVSEFLGPGEVPVYFSTRSDNKVFAIVPIGPSEGTQTVSYSATCFSGAAGTVERKFQFGPEVPFPKTIGNLAITGSGGGYALLGLTEEAIAFLPVAKLSLRTRGSTTSESPFYGDLPPGLALVSSNIVITEATWHFPCDAPGPTTFPVEVHYDLAGTDADPAPLEANIAFNCPARGLPIPAVPPDVTFTPPVPRRPGQLGEADDTPDPKVINGSDGCACSQSSRHDRLAGGSILVIATVIAIAGQRRRRER